MFAFLREPRRERVSGRSSGARNRNHTDVLPTVLVTVQPLLAAGVYQLRFIKEVPDDAGSRPRQNLEVCICGAPGWLRAGAGRNASLDGHRWDWRHDRTLRCYGPECEMKLIARAIDPRDDIAGRKRQFACGARGAEREILDLKCKPPAIRIGSRPDSSVVIAVRDVNSIVAARWSIITDAHAAPGRRPVGHAP